MNAENWISTYLKEYPGKRDSWNKKDGYVLLGAMQMYQASGEKAYLDFVENHVKCFVGEDGAILWDVFSDADVCIHTCGRVLFFLYEKTGQECYRKALDAAMERIRTQEWSLTALPFYMEYETKCGKKEKYNDIVGQFELAQKETMEDGSDFLMQIVDTMEHTSIEIYEKYRTLQDLYKLVLKKELSDGKKNRRICYSILKACRMGILLKEKYADFGMEMAENLIEQVCEDVDGKVCVGYGMMLYAQYLILQKEME